MRPQHLSLRAVGGLLLAAAPLQAQTVQVVVVEEQSGNAAASSLVSLLTPGGVRVIQGLADQFGRVTLRAPTPGEYLVRGDRIGYVGRTIGPMMLSEGETAQLRLQLPMTRSVLPEVIVQSASKCTVAGVARQDINVVWEEARKALASTVLTGEQLRPVLRVVGHEREWDRRGRLVREDTAFVKRGTGNPFYTLPVDTLIERGFSREESGHTMFYAPDAPLLLSDGFLETHCFSLAADEVDGRRRIGLRFAPIPERTIPDIAGTLWLDPVENLLEEVEFEYVNSPPPWDTNRAGGEVRFARVAGLGWIVNAWTVRMPKVVALEQRPGDGRSRWSRGSLVRVEGVERSPKAAPVEVRFEQRGKVERSGRADPVEAGGRVVTAVGGSILGEVFDSVTGLPLSGATVALEGSESVVRSDSVGHFAVNLGINGPVSVRITHPRLEVFGVPALHDLVVLPGDTTRIHVAIPSPSTWLAGRCGAGVASDERLGAIVGLLSGPDGQPGAGVLGVSWDQSSFSGGVAAVRTRLVEATPGPDGWFLICSVPVDTPLRLRLNALPPRTITGILKEQRILALRLTVPDPPQE